MRYLSKGATGRIGGRGRIILGSIKTYGKWFNAGFYRVTGTIAPEDLRHQVYHVRAGNVILFPS